MIGYDVPPYKYYFITLDAAVRFAMLVAKREHREVDVWSIDGTPEEYPGMMGYLCHDKRYLKHECSCVAASEQ